MMKFILGFALYLGLLVALMAFFHLLSSPNTPSWLKNFLVGAPKVIGGVILFAFVGYFFLNVAAVAVLL